MRPHQAAAAATNPRAAQSYMEAGKKIFLGIIQRADPARYLYEVFR
jgi:hypothetical protein